MVLIRGVESDFNIAGCIRKAFPWGKVARAQPVTDEGKGGKYLGILGGIPPPLRGPPPFNKGG